MRTIGVLGGMGPAAGADFYARVVAGHGALRDQDHPPCILYSATQVPDRTAHLVDGGPDPAPELVAAARLVESAGADFIAIPCNSAHAFLDAIREALAIPVLDMIALAVSAVDRAVPQAKRVGLLAATGTAKVGLYDRPLRDSGRQPVYPKAKIQEEVMAAIRDVKGGGESSLFGEDNGAAGGNADPRLVAAAEHLGSRGADCLIMACTEIPLALDPIRSPLAAIDANQVLVETTLALATGRIDFEEVSHAVR